MRISDLSYIEVVSNPSIIVGGETTMVAESSSTATVNGPGTVESSSTVSLTSLSSTTKEDEAINKVTEILEQKIKTIKVDISL